jgi:hypothetical protein
MSTVKLKLGQFAHPRTVDAIPDNELSGMPVPDGKGSVPVTYMKEKDLVGSHHTYGDCYLSWGDMQKIFEHTRGQLGEPKLTPFQIEHARNFDYVLWVDNRHG